MKEARKSSLWYILWVIGAVVAGGIISLTLAHITGMKEINYWGIPFLATVIFSYKTKHKIRKRRA